MPKAKRLRPKRNVRDFHILMITCIYEYERFSKWTEGPTIHKVRELLLTVYALDVNYTAIGSLIVGFNNNLLYLKDAQVRLTNAGRNYFNLYKSSIIPPQTVAQP